MCVIVLGEASNIALFAGSSPLRSGLPGFGGRRPWGQAEAADAPGVKGWPRVEQSVVRDAVGATVPAPVAWELFR